MYKLEEVFGVLVKTPHSHIQRDKVDKVFKSHIRSDKHIIVYGSSKQGKSTLAAKHLTNQEKITVYLDPGVVRSQIYAQILREFGVEFVDEVVKSRKVTAGASISAKVKALIPFVGGGESAATANANLDIGSQEKRKPINIELSSANDVGKLLVQLGKGKIYILENFHYVDESVQEELAYDLRTFHDLELQFIILGVWKEKNRLVQYNGDLLSRLVEVPVEPWTSGDFREVVARGSRLLNVSISQWAINHCIEQSCSSIAVFQELVKSICLKANVLNDTLGLQTAGKEVHVREAISELVDVYETRYIRILESLASYNRRVDKVSRKCKPGMMYYLVMAILGLSLKSFAQSFDRDELFEIVESYGRKFKGPSITDNLKRLPAIQKNVKISPPVFDYDTITRRVHVVDSLFLFYIKNVDIKKVKRVLKDLVD